ncbi:MAG: glutamate 5-kinase [Acidimicrobiaceae bacterium]|nr:glutamate 5-kinase [Acidimicrobiaceae bacterium]
MRLVVKLGSSSVTGGDGSISHGTLRAIASQIAAIRDRGHFAVIVSSGAIAAGLNTLGIVDKRPSDLSVLQALSAVGQSRLMAAYNQALGGFGLIAGQVLLTPLDFINRQQYLHARQTLEKLLELGVIPVINENDAVADDEIRFGDNDRIAALVANLITADLLVLLTDQNGVYTSDPRVDAKASLVEEIDEISEVLKAAAGGPGTQRGSGGMASKLQAASIASWSGVDVLIASATRELVLVEACDRRPGLGTYVNKRKVRLSARKLWIAFANPSVGRVLVDDGAKSAILEHSSSLLSIGVHSFEGSFLEDDPVEVCDLYGEVIAKGLVRVSAEDLRLATKSKVTDSQSPSSILIHRDDLVVLV